LYASSGSVSLRFVGLIGFAEGTTSRLETPSKE
jgi:hypothetical protein